MNYTPDMKCRRCGSNEKVALIPLFLDDWPDRKEYLCDICRLEILRFIYWPPDSPEQFRIDFPFTMKAKLNRKIRTEMLIENKKN